MTSYTIPRGIKVREIVAYGLNGKQIIYLGVGIIGAIGVCSLPIHFDLKIAGCIASTVGSVFLSLAKRHSQDLDKYVWNSIKYPLRQKEWGDVDVATKTNTIKVSFHTRKSSTA